MPGTQQREQDSSVPCRYCRDPIDRAALICKSCGEPQVLSWRATRFFSGLLSSVVALGSLWFAYLQHEDARQANQEAKTAQKQANVAQAGEAAQVQASQMAVQQILGYLPPSAHTNIIANLSRHYGPFPNAQTLKKQITEEPANPTLRANLLFRQFVAPNERP